LFFSLDLSTKLVIACDFSFSGVCVGGAANSQRS